MLNILSPFSVHNVSLEAIRIREQMCMHGPQRYLGLLISEEANTNHSIHSPSSDMMLFDIFLIQ